MLREEESLQLVQRTLNTGRDERSLLDIQEMFQVDQINRLGQFQPHPETDDVTDMTLEWVDELGFLNDRNREQVRAWATMTGYAHQGERRIVDLDAYVYGAIYIIDDWLSNDAQKNHLSQSEQAVLKEYIKLAIGSLMQVEAGVDPFSLLVDFDQFATRADNDEARQFLQKTSRIFAECWRLFLEVAKETDTDFARGYATVLRQHLLAGMTDQDAAIAAEPDTDKYIDIRIEVAGMKVGRKLVEMTSGSYLGLRTLKDAVSQRPTEQNTRVLQLIEELEKNTDDFGCVGNDVFSVAKEVFRDGTIFNFVAVSIMHLADGQDPETIEYLSLYDQAIAATQLKISQIIESFVGKVLGDSQAGIPAFTEVVDGLQESDLGVDSPLSLAEVKQQLKEYVQGLIQYFQATYYWEQDPEGGLARYQYLAAIFAQLMPNS